MVNNRLKITLFLLYFVLSNSVQARVNSHHSKEGQTIILDISQSSLNRLYVKGLRITNIRAVKNQLVWKKDEKKGELYIAPFSKISTRPINFFLQDEAGNVYTIIARPKSIPSQSHEFIPNQLSIEKAVSWERDASYPKTVAKLIASLYNHKTPAGYLSARLAVSVVIWKETDLMLVRRVTGPRFIGETYKIKNLDSKMMVLHEQEFVRNVLNRQQKIKGVAIDDHRLAPNAFTYVHIVRTK